MPNPLRLDPGLDFVVHDDGMIELTEAGFRRMGQAHSAGLDTVIKIDGRDVFHFLATKLRGASPDRQCLLRGRTLDIDPPVQDRLCKPYRGH